MSTASADLSVQRSGLSVERSESTAVDSANPWLGLASFTEETRGFFHGRDEEVAELGRRVQRKLLTILFGQSGLGKTSILRAGIVPRLRPEGYCPVYVRLDYGRESPPPSEQIKQAIFRATREAGQWAQTGVAQAGESLWEFLHHRDDVLKDRRGRTLIPLLIFDQFEEIFTLAQGDDFGRQRAAQFLEDLADLVENRPPRALEARLEADEAGLERFDFTRADYRLLIALREDYLAHLEGLKGQMPSVTQNRMRLARMSGAQALAAVRRPGRELVNEEVAAAIVRFVAGGAELERAEVEPSLLSLVCRELNEARRARGHHVISADLLAGSRETILTEFYERTLADQPPGVRAFLEDELLTDSGFRESIAEERVKKGLAAAGAAPDALAQLIDRRLLRVEERLDVRRVELTHDVLCGVVVASRDVRREREGKAAVERQLAETRAREAAAARALVRARLIAATCAVLALGALGGAIIGYTSTKRAQTAEGEARRLAAEAERAEELAEAARLQAEDLLGFVVSDLEEQLTDFGQLPILLHVTRKAVAYYEGMPAGLKTPSTRAAHARALANLGSVLDVQADQKGSRARLEQSLALYEQIEKEGVLEGPMRIGYASALRRMARLLSSEVKFAEGAATCELAEKVLAPALAEPGLAGAAQAELSMILDRRGFCVMRGGRPKDAVTQYERALQAALEADRLTGRPRPGLAPAFVKVWYSEALARANRRGDAIAVLEQARAALREFLQKEPFLASAMRQLASAANNASSVAQQEWRFEEMDAARRESADAYRQLLKLDPKNGVYRGNLANVEGSHRGVLWQEGRYREYEKVAAASTAANTAEGTSSFSKGNAAIAFFFWAAADAAFGNDRAADEHLWRGEGLVRELTAGQNLDSTDRVLDDMNWKAQALGVQGARLNWSVVRRESEAALDRLEREVKLQAGDERRRRAEAGCWWRIMVSTKAEGDFAAAKRALDRYWALREPPGENPPAQERLDEANEQLERAEVLWGTGDAAGAREILARLETESTALLARAPAAKFTQILQARVLWLQSRVGQGLAREQKHALLEQALEIFNRFHVERRLTRYETEVLRLGIRADLERP
jgi:hypothetical protein